MTPCLPPVQPILAPSSPQNEAEAHQKRGENLEVSPAKVSEGTSLADKEPKVCQKSGQCMEASPINAEDATIAPVETSKQVQTKGQSGDSLQGGPAPKVYDRASLSFLNSASPSNNTTDESEKFLASRNVSEPQSPTPRPPIETRTLALHGLKDQTARNKHSVVALRATFHAPATVCTIKDG